MHPLAERVAKTNTLLAREIDDALQPSHPPSKARDKATLEQKIMDAGIAKNDAEWWAMNEITHLRVENWQLRGVLGYPTPGDIPPSTEFKCGLCEARKQGIEGLEE